jgi:hypothetical protein
MWRPGVYIPTADGEVRHASMRRVANPIQRLTEKKLAN